MTHQLVLKQQMESTGFSALQGDKIQHLKREHLCKEHINIGLK